jgi:hypothetical protein
MVTVTVFPHINVPRSGIMQNARSPGLLRNQRRKILGEPAGIRIFARIDRSSGWRTRIIFQSPDVIPLVDVTRISRPAGIPGQRQPRPDRRCAAFMHR